MKATSSAKREQIALGIDYGETNIGLAFGRAGLVTPLKVVSGKNSHIAVQEIARVVVENKVTQLVFGLPKNSDGQETPQCLKVRQFAKLLRVYLKLPTVFVDEYMSTHEALGEAIDLNISMKRRKSLDDLSAAIILKKYYRENA